MVEPSHAPRSGRIVRTTVTCVLVLLSWLGGAVVVRVGLDLTDRLPYSSLSEWLYLLVAVCALGVAVGGRVLAVRRHRRRASGAAVSPS